MLTSNICLPWEGNVPAPTESKPWQRLRGKIAAEVLVAPRTAADPSNQGQWPEVPHRVVFYLEHNVLDKPWRDPLALLAPVMLARRFELVSVFNKLSTLHNGFGRLFEALGLVRMEDWNATKHVPIYLKSDVLPEDTPVARRRFWMDYNSASKTMAIWLLGLPQKRRPAYEPLTLPVVPAFFVQGLIPEREIVERQQQKRKAETGAVVPRFIAIRSEAHLRFNRVARLRRAYREALQSLGPQPRFPVTFSYDEGGDNERGIPAQERLWFTIWDRRSFVQAHPEAYYWRTVSYARTGVGAFATDLNRPFLEFVRAERLLGDAPPAGFWFADLLKLGVVGQRPYYGSPENVRKKHAWLASWGYARKPFRSDVAGLLTWPEAEITFMRCAQLRCQGVLLPVESLYATALFGLMAIDLFTTTGARINEVMQIHLTDDCIVRLKMPAPPESEDQTARLRYILRLVPKGEKTNTPKDYFIGEQTKHLLVKLAQMLGEHYHLEPGQALPSVPFHAHNGRAHRFGTAPYLFQYSGGHMSGETISSCMRFLLHGMVFKTREGKLVVLKSHLLRHAFATHVVQVEKIPVDIVGAWLHQKDLTTTEYYSKPTENMVAEAADVYLARIASEIDVDKAVLRTPPELQQLYEEARGKAGTLADVIGGQCVSHGYCAAKFACVGCAGKVPDPAKRGQVERHKQWASLQVDYATKEGLLPEAERMKQLMRDCDNELEEMNLIESYQRDEHDDIRIHIKPPA
jgi:integrase